MKVRKTVKEDIGLLIKIRMDYLFAEKVKPLYESLGFRVSNYTSMNKLL